MPGLKLHTRAHCWGCCALTMGVCTPPIDTSTVLGVGASASAEQCYSADHNHLEGGSCRPNTPLYTVHPVAHYLYADSKGVL